MVQTDSFVSFFSSSMGVITNLNVQKNNNDRIVIDMTMYFILTKKFKNSKNKKK